MSRPTHLFIGGELSTPDITATIEAAFGATFTVPEDDTPHLIHGNADIYAGTHDFDDDDLRWPDGTTIALRSEYPHHLEVRDTTRDHAHQQELARRAFETLKATGRGKLLYVDNLQHILDSYDPTHPVDQQTR